MKKTLFTVTVVAVLLLALVLLSGCDKKPSETTAGDVTTGDVTTATGAPLTTTATTSNAPTEYLSLEGWGITRKESDKGDILTGIKNLKTYIEDGTGVSIKVSTDFNKPGDNSFEAKKEILVGNTNRAASIELKALLDADAENDYYISYKGNKIAIVGKDELSLMFAMREFIVRYVGTDALEGKLKIKEEFTFKGKVNNKVELLENFAAIEVLKVSTVQGTHQGSVWPTYGRIMQLQHNGENNGTLYATSQWSGKSFPVYRSTNDGTNWKRHSTVVEQLDKNLIGNWQPHIYELPCQVGEMPEGTLLLAGCSRDENKDGKGVSITKMCIWRSYDLGKTWEEFTVVDVGGGTVLDDGMYEPFLICDKDGSLVCFYSDETEVWQSGGQRLVFKASKDGVNWGEKKYCVAPKDKTLRPGMVTVAQMGDEGYILAYEMIGQTKGGVSGPVYTKVSKNLQDWGDPEDVGKRVAADGEVTGCTPYIVWTPAGGEHGAVITAGRFGSSSPRSMSKLFVSFDLGETWDTFENSLPFGYDFENWTTPNYAYSFGFFGGADGSVYYINNVFPDDKNFVGKQSDLKMAKLKIYSPLEVIPTE